MGTNVMRDLLRLPAIAIEADLDLAVARFMGVPVLAKILDHLGVGFGSDQAVSQSSGKLSAFGTSRRNHHLGWLIGEAVDTCVLDAEMLAVMAHTA